MPRRFQFSLKTLTAGVFILGIVLGILRWLGPDAIVAMLLIAAASAGAFAGWIVGLPGRGALFGVVAPIFYVLSIQVVEHVGHRAGWPGSSWTCCSLYESLWYRQSPFGSETLWHGYWFWTTWCEVMSQQFGAERPMNAASLAAVILVCGTMLWVRRRQHPVFVAPLGTIAAGLALVSCHDFDAAFLGFATGSLATIVLSKRERKAFSNP
ncbi:MAG TPA: hypothetical protein VGN42_00500 [Pirellulales bacterium]|jgi:membrane protein implicated in regulation of membrane protease activity|nr:hypothetical protein [Pirellulales bacterium]